jgi:hypothetical protein
MRIRQGLEREVRRVEVSVKWPPACELVAEMSEL